MSSESTATLTLRGSHLSMELSHEREVVGNQGFSCFQMKVFWENVQELFGSAGWSMESNT